MNWIKMAKNISKWRVFKVTIMNFWMLSRVSVNRTPVWIGSSLVVTTISSYTLKIIVNYSTINVTYKILTVKKSKNLQIEAEFIQLKRVP
jgi:hypothetical protein